MALMALLLSAGCVGSLLTLAFVSDARTKEYRREINILNNRVNLLDDDVDQIYAHHQTQSKEENDASDQ